MSNIDDRILLYDRRNVLNPKSIFHSLPLVDLISYVVQLAHKVWVSTALLGASVMSTDLQLFNRHLKRAIVCRLLTGYL